MKFNKNSNFLKGLIDIGTGAVNVLDEAINKLDKINSLFGLLNSGTGGTLGAISGLLMNKAGIGECTMFQW